MAYKGILELGKRESSVTKDYEKWLNERIMGADPIHPPQDPLLGNEVQEINEELTRRLKRKEKELEDFSKM